MADISQLPTRARFVMDRVGDWADAYGWDFAPCGEGLYEHAGVLALADIDSARNGYVTMGADTLGQLWDVSTYDSPQRATLYAFEWAAEPTDTGTMHGPHATYCDGCGTERATHGTLCADCAEPMTADDILPLRVAVARGLAASGIAPGPVLA